MNDTSVVKMPNIQQKTKHEECQLGVLGFLNDRTIQALQLERVISAYATNSLLTDSNQTNEGYRSLGMPDLTEKFRAIMEHGACELLKSYDVDRVTIITPGLELLTKEMLSDLGPKFFSLSSALAEECARQKLKHVGLIGTEWDTAENGALVTALRHHRIRAYGPPNLKARQQMLICAQMGLLGSVEYEDKIFTTENFCLEVAKMIREQEPKLDGIVICNFELQSLAKRIEGMFPSMKVVNAGQIFLELTRNFILQKRS